jgi:hypothetical protein
VTPKQEKYYKCVKRVIELTEDFKTGYELFRLIGGVPNQLITGRCDGLVKNGLMEVKYDIINNREVKCFRRKVLEYTLQEYEKSIERKQRAAYDLSRKYLKEIPQREGVTVHSSDKPYTPEYLAWAKQERKQRKSARVQANSMDYGAF